MLRRGVRARYRECERAGDRDDVDYVGGSSGLERREERTQAPDAPEIVRPHDILDRRRIALEEARAARDAGVVREQRDRGMSLEDSPGGLVDGVSVGDVAHLGLSADLIGKH